MDITQKRREEKPEELEKPANGAEVPTGSRERAAEEPGPGEQTDARKAEAEHMVGDRRQVSSPGGMVSNKRSGRS